MAKRSRRTTASSASSSLALPEGSSDRPSGGETTGRYICIFREGATQSAMGALSKAAGLKRVCRSEDFESGALDMEQAEGADVVFFDQLNAAVLSADETQSAALAELNAEESSPILAMEPEQIMYATALMQQAAEAGGQNEYIRGYRDGVLGLSSRLIGGERAEPNPAPGEEAAVAAFADTLQATWGLQATRAINSRFTGRGIRVAVLDTGLDLAHPDFSGRGVTHRSFIPGQPTQDGHGHGTHCTGTALGARTAHGGNPAHGCAPGGGIFIGKVLSNGGSGGDAGILAGINWAITCRCQVISMSLGAPVPPGASPSPVYEAIGQRALAAGSLIIAAAGNDSRRPGHIAPVSRPANCPSIMAVAAVDSNLRVASFSCGAINPNGGGVDIAGPGVNILSTLPRPRLHGRLNGTSMATPHVAGIAALWAESNRTLRGRALWQVLVSHARRLPDPARDVGAGLVQAP